MNQTEERQQQLPQGALLAAKCACMVQPNLTQQGRDTTACRCLRSRSILAIIMGDRGEGYWSALSVHTKQAQGSTRTTCDQCLVCVWLHGCCLIAWKGQRLCWGWSTTPSKCQRREAMCPQLTMQPHTHNTGGVPHRGKLLHCCPHSRLLPTDSTLLSASKHGNKNVCEAANVGTTRHMYV